MIKVLLFLKFWIFVDYSILLTYSFNNGIITLKLREERKMEKFNIDKFVQSKIDDLQKTDRTFKSIYSLMFRDDLYSGEHHGSDP